MTAVVQINKYRTVHSLNASHGDNWVYVGRGDEQHQQPRSVLANPFKRGNRERGATLPAYKRWLWKQIKNRNEAVLAELRKIKPNTVIVCHCPQPGPCHGHVVADAAKYVREQNL